MGGVGEEENPLQMRTFPAWNFANFRFEKLRAVICYDVEEVKRQCFPGTKSCQVLEFQDFELSPRRFDFPVFVQNAMCWWT